MLGRCACVRAGAAALVGGVARAAHVGVRMRMRVPVQQPPPLLLLRGRAEWGAPRRVPAWAPAATRSMCTGVPFLSIRGAVRKLALLMHPDRVAQFAEARAANGAVLQVLNELQSAARRDASDARSDGRTAACRIYYRWDSSPFAERPVGAQTVRLRSEADGQLYEFLVVDVTLDVPAGGIGVRKRRQLVAQQLSDLLASSGVTGVVQARVAQASEAAGADGDVGADAAAAADEDDDALDLESVPIVSEDKLNSMRSVVRDFARGYARVHRVARARAPALTAAATALAGRRWRGWPTAGACFCSRTSWSACCAPWPT
jgi:hypothetical protein